jgi:hypothetical protein
MKQTPRFQTENATKSDAVRQSIFQSAIAALLNHELNFSLGDGGEVHVQDPDHIQLGLNPSEGCRAVVSVEKVTCECSVFSELGLCSHSVAAFIWSQRVGHEQEQIAQAA